MDQPPVVRKLPLHVLIDLHSDACSLSHLATDHSAALMLGHIWPGESCTTHLAYDGYMPHI